MGNGGRPAPHHPIPGNMWTEGLSTADRLQKKEKKKKKKKLDFRRVGIRESCPVDLAAEHALEKSVKDRLAVPYSDIKVLTNMYSKKLWQTELERYPEN